MGLGLGLGLGSGLGLGLGLALGLGSGLGLGLGLGLGFDQSLAKGTLRAATRAEPAPPSGSEGRESDRRNEGMKPGAWWG